MAKQQWFEVYVPGTERMNWVQSVNEKGAIKIVKAMDPQNKKLDWKAKLKN